MGGALRSRSVRDIESLVEKAFNEDPVLTMKCLFYLRDVRGGQGERRVFRTAMKFLTNLDTNAVSRNLKQIPKFGRFDDMFSFMGTYLEDEAVDLIDTQLASDLKSDKPSLLAKWLPSENTSSKSTVALAIKLRMAIGLTSRQYRKALSKLRAQIKVVERDMCAKEWGKINFQSVPSNAATRYRKAFKKHDTERYTEFLAKVKAGTAKINAATLYPYDLLKAALKTRGDETIEAQWSALPNYIENGKDINALAVVDVSGSMISGQEPAPIMVSVSLGIYLAERAKGPFHNMFITFTSRPSVVEVTGKNLSEKYNSVTKHVGYDTNLVAAFEQILYTAMTKGCSQEDMPEMIFVISDMEFNDSNVGGSRLETNFDSIDKRFKEAGFVRPKLVFWNVAARNNNLPVTQDEAGTFLVSGASPSILRAALNTKVTTPYDLMLEVLNSPRYAEIT